MSKRSLMLSTAAVALMTGAAFATDTTIDAAKTTPYTTGALLTGNTGEINAGNITVKTTGSVTVSAAQGALVIDTDNWILNQGAITNKDKQGAQGIHVDLSADRDLRTASFTNLGLQTVTGNGIYLDAGAAISLTGSGTGKSGIILDTAGCAASVTACTFKGSITTLATSSLSVNGDVSHAIDLGSKAVLLGDLTIGGAVSASAESTTESSTSVFGLYSLGTIQGNVSILANGGSLTAYGAGARAMEIQGGGVTGYIQIGGTVGSGIINQVVTNYNDKPNTTTNPEAGPAVDIGASVGGGIAILGPATPTDSTALGAVTMQGASVAFNISNSAATSPLTIGVYSSTADPGSTINPGFSFYNRGNVSATYTNYNKSNTAMSIAAASAGLPTKLTGGFFNSGLMTSAVLTNGTGQSSTSAFATAIYLGSNVQLLPGTGKNAGSGSDPGDQAAFVNSGAVSAQAGIISASVSGSRGGTARAIFIAPGASVPSLINTGTIAASVSTTDATLAGNTTGSANPVTAIAIFDGSGTLINIYNAGSIGAAAGYQASQNANISPLDNNSQSSIAIGLGGGATSVSASGVTIKNWSSASRAASITGDILFGTGNNQILDLQGNGPTLASTINGNVTFGMVATGGTSGDRLHIGNYAALTGEVTTQETVPGAGVQVDVETHGVLNLLNTSSSLNATSFNVATGGTVALGVNKSLTAVGGVVAAQQVNFASNATLGVTYASFVPATEHQFVLMTADTGQLSISQSTIDAFNHPVDPTQQKYLLATATMCITSSPDCVKPAGVGAARDALIIDVRPKTVTELGLTAGSLPVRTIKTEAGTDTTFFKEANIALGADNALGSAFINGIHNAAEAQQAYNNMAPNLTGGTRAIAISITDSATGPVGARQRALRMYGKTGGEMTVWGEEFVTMIKDPGSGALDPNTHFKTNPGFKDHGIGFALGIDGGSPKYGWYGGALTFYAGDVNELSRNSHQNQQWYLLSLYSAWRGTGLFLDTKLDAGYGHIDGKRLIALPVSTSASYLRVAENKHAGALISGSVSTGAMMSYGATTIMPQISVDGLYVREEGYTEKNNGTTTVGDGFNLKVNQSYAKSLRVFAGLDVRYDLKLWDFFLQPEARAGYRYDLISDPLKLKMAFAYADTSSTAPAPGTVFTLIGPDPAKGNFVLGGTLAATTDTWSLGLGYDLVRGSGGAFQQTATLHLIGRI